MFGLEVTGLGTCVGDRCPTADPGAAGGPANLLGLAPDRERRRIVAAENAVVGQIRCLRCEASRVAGLGIVPIAGDTGRRVRQAIVPSFAHGGCVFERQVSGHMKTNQCASCPEPQRRSERARRASDGGIADKRAGGGGRSRLGEMVVIRAPAGTSKNSPFSAINTAARISRVVRMWPRSSSLAD